MAIIPPLIVVGDSQYVVIERFIGSDDLLEAESAVGEGGVRVKIRFE